MYVINKIRCVNLLTVLLFMKIISGVTPYLVGAPRPWFTKMGIILELSMGHTLLIYSIESRL